MWGRASRLCSACPAQGSNCSHCTRNLQELLLPATWSINGAISRDSTFTEQGYPKLCSRSSSQIRRPLHRRPGSAAHRWQSEWSATVLTTWQAGGLLHTGVPCPHPLFSEGQMRKISPELATWGWTPCGKLMPLAHLVSHSLVPGAPWHHSWSKPA